MSEAVETQEAIPFLGPLKIEEFDLGEFRGRLDQKVVVKLDGSVFGNLGKYVEKLVIDQDGTLLDSLRELLLLKITKWRESGLRIRSTPAKLRFLLDSIREMGLLFSLEVDKIDPALLVERRSASKSLGYYLSLLLEMASHYSDDRNLWLNDIRSPIQEEGETEEREKGKKSRDPKQIIIDQLVQRLEEIDQQMREEFENENQVSVKLAQERAFLKIIYFLVKKGALPVERYFPESTIA